LAELSQARFTAGVSINPLAKAMLGNVRHPGYMHTVPAVLPLSAQRVSNLALDKPGLVCCGSAAFQLSEKGPSLRPQALKLVVVFIVGGTTFQEARLVAELNAAGEQQRCCTLTELTSAAVLSAVPLQGRILQHVEPCPAERGVWKVLRVYGRSCVCMACCQQPCTCFAIGDVTCGNRTVAVRLEAARVLVMCSRSHRKAMRAGEKGQGWSAGTRIVLGGTGVQNSRSFLRDIQELMQNERHARN